MVTLNFETSVQNLAHKTQSSLNYILPPCTWSFGLPCLLTLDGSPTFPMGVPIGTKPCRTHAHPLPPVNAPLTIR